jgi:fermentation-respiration switch protein FrsA (DUF1100 family)
VWHRVLYVAAALIAVAILFFAGGRLMLEALERQLIYFPTRVDRDAATPRVAGAAVEEVWIAGADGVRVHGLYATVPGGLADLLYFHGNAGSLYDRLDLLELLVGSGFNVLMMDYRGYGKSEGTPSEPALYDDARAAYRYLVEERDVPAERLVLFGSSLGSAVAIELATSEAAGALIVESAFTNVRELARLHYGWLPDALLRSLSHEFDSLAKVARLRTPVLYLHGTADDIVPLRMGRRLYEASPDPREWYEIRGAGHNDMVWTGGSAYFERLADFVRRHLAGDA